MLERDAYGRLLEWKLANRGKALLVNGARQVGKTFLVEEFARREYPHLVKVDFLRDEATSVALSRARSADEVVEAIGILRGSRLVPGETLVFFDEVQAALNVVTLSKYLVQDDRFGRRHGGDAH
jgi:predicted AAA+ superfamily ATPase